MKVLNLYAGIGGNRKLWTDCEVTAVEFNPEIAAIYADLYPNDTVVVGDAHQYLLDHYKEFDFIWGSPPCPTHSITNHFLNAQGIIRYPDMSLYQEIIFLQHFFTGKYCIENVKPYYEPLIKPQVSGRHCFWANFKIPKLNYEKTIGRMCGSKDELGATQQQLRNQNQQNTGLVIPKSQIGRFGPVKSKGGERSEGDNQSVLGFDLSKYKYADKNKLLNNCVIPEIGLAIFNSAKGIIESNNFIQNQLF